MTKRMGGDLKRLGTQMGAGRRCVLGFICDALERRPYSEWI